MGQGLRIESWGEFFARLKNNLAVIGGGGKTGLIGLMEAYLRKAGRPLLVTVTTRLGRGQLPWLERVEAANLPQALDCARRAAEGQRLLLAGPYVSDQKLAGLPLEWFGPLRREAGTEMIFLVEADGAAGRPLKAHNEREPVLPPLEKLQVVAVLGLSALLKPFSESVHRPEIFGRYGPAVSGGTILSPKDIAAFVKAAWRALPIDMIFLNQADLLQTKREKALGESLAWDLAEAGWPVFLGSLWERDQRSSR